MSPGQEPPSEIFRDRVSFDETGQQARWSTSSAVSLEDAEAPSVAVGALEAKRDVDALLRRAPIRVG
jgi:hypothetical protein